MSNYYQYFSDPPSANPAGINKLKEDYLAGKIPMLNFVNFQKISAEAKKYGSYIRNNYKRLVIIGTGGSILNPKMFFPFSDHKIEVIFLDNTEQDNLFYLLKQINPAEDFFLVISKSGETAEILALVLTLFKLNSINPHNWLMITEKNHNSLHRLASDNNIAVLEHPADIGGRFASFTLVSLLPAAVFGLSVEHIFLAAQRAIEELLLPSSSAHIGAAALVSQGKNMLVSIIYSYKLTPYNEWYRQIIAESLGKEGKGFTVIPSLGQIDRHSQLQLYLEGPRDKFFSVITNDEIENLPSLEQFNGYNLTAIMHKMQDVTLENLQAYKLPYRHIRLDDINVDALVYLIVQSLIETLLIADLWQINPLSQPAVDSGKIMIKQSFGA